MMVRHYVEWGHGKKIFAFNSLMDHIWTLPRAKDKELLMNLAKKTVHRYPYCNKITEKD